MASAGGIRMGKVFVEIGADSSKFFASVAGLNKQIGKIGSAMSKVGRQMMTVGAAAGAPFLLAARSAAKFDDVMRNMSASAGVSSSDLGRVRTAAMDMSAALGVGPTEAAQGFLELIKAGVPLEKVLGGAGQAATEFAKVGNMDVGQAAVVMADAMNVFGVSASHAANSISAAADASSTSIELIAQSMAQVGAVAGLTNQSIDDTTASIAILANAGIKGSDAGTSLKTMLMRLSSPADDAAKAMAEIGLSTDSFRGADGKMRPMAEMLGTLNTAMDGMDQAAKDDVFRRIFGSDAIRAAAVLTNAGVEGFGAMRTSMADAKTVGEKFKEMMGGLTGSGKALMSALDRLAIVVGNALAPSLTKAFGFLTSLTQAAVNFASENQQLVASVAEGIAGFIAAGAAIFGVGVTLTYATGAIGTVFAGISGLSAILAVVLSPLGLFVAALAALVIAGPEVRGQMLGAFGGLGEMISGIGQGLSETFGPTLEAGMGTLKQLGEIATTTFGGIYDAITAGDLSMAMEILWAGLLAGWLRGVADLMSVVDPWVEAFQNVFTDLGANIYIAWDQMWTALATTDIGATILGVFDNIANGAMATFDFMVASIQKAWIQVQDFISGATDTQEKIDKIDAENKSRADQRAQDRPGIEGRQERAKNKAGEMQQEAKDRQAAVLAGAEETKAGRAVATANAQAGREAAAGAAEAKVGAMAAGAAKKKEDEGIAKALIDKLSAAKSIEDLTALGQDISNLADRDAIGGATLNKVYSAYNAAAERILAAEATAGAGGAAVPGTGGAAGGGGAGGPDAGAANQAAAKTETVGTFSAFAAQGMGFGSTIEQKQLDALNRIADNTDPKNSDEGAIEP